MAKFTSTPLILTFVLISSFLDLGSCTPVLDITGNQVVTGTQYYLRQVDKFGTIGSGMTYEVHSSWDYVLFTVSTSSNGTSMFVWDSKSFEKPGLTVDTVNQSINLQMTHSNYGGYDRLFTNIYNWLYLDNEYVEALNVYQIDGPNYAYSFGYPTGVGLYCLTVYSTYQNKRWLGFDNVAPSRKCDVDNSLFVSFYPA